ncbi:MAG TPA: carboxypeptidase regulatory-like domain-containing protein [Candidatus Aquilonibacter sp.]|nr:carboxypeptidase regulatory-like domain-containing protein [Candidatus Aquilonibacter sp.]
MIKHRRWMCVFVLPVFAAAIAVAAAPNDNKPASTSTKKTSTSSARRGPIAPPVVTAQAESSGGNLPVRRVVLYKSGVGFFEHQGQVDGNETVDINFTSGQLNDVLQSLTVLDLSGGRITGVDYNSDAPLAQRLGTLSLPLAEDTNIENFYSALRGVRLEMRDGTNVVTGRLLSVERKTRVSGGNTLEVDLATLVSDSGEVRSVEITPAVSVQVADRDASQEVNRYLSLLASVRQEEMRRMTIATAGSGERSLYVSYISEVPIWKTTYRIVLPSKSGEEPLLQGWAIVDNTVGEDWDNVELSLVSGAPQSFIQQLSQPYYARRPVVPLPQLAQLMPQTHEGAMLGGVTSLSGVVTDESGAVIPGASVTLLSPSGQTAGSVVTDSAGYYQFGDLPAGNYQLQANARGFQATNVQGLSLGGGRAATQDMRLQVGTESQTVTVSASTNGIETDSVSASRSRSLGSSAELGGSLGGVLGNGRGDGVGYATGTGSAYAMAGTGTISAARQQMSSAAEGSDLGDLFEYKLKDRVTIHKNESALVPIIQTHVEAEKVSLWNQSLGSERPLRALWLTNSSNDTLDGGSFSVLEDETFAGEGITDPIKPGEKRIISYATDLGVRVDRSNWNEVDRVNKVRILHGLMTQTSEQRTTTTYTIRNDDTTGRTVLIEHPVRVGWSLNPNDAKPDETTSNVYRFRVSVGAKGTATFTVREASPVQSQYALTNLTSDEVALFVRQKSINPEIEAALRKILAQKDLVSQLAGQISDNDDATQKIFDDQARLRENMKALKGTPEERALTQRYTQQLSDQENQLDTLKKQAADLQDKQDAAQKQLDEMIESLSMDADI